MRDRFVPTMETNWNGVGKMVRWMSYAIRWGGPGSTWIIENVHLAHCNEKTWHQARFWKPGLRVVDGKWALEPREGTN